MLFYFKALCIFANLGLLALVGWQIVDYMFRERSAAGVDDQYLRFIGVTVLFLLAIIAPFI